MTFCLCIARLQWAALRRVLPVLLLAGLCAACQSPPDETDLLAAAEAHAAAGDYDRAIASQSKAVALAPGDAGRRLRLAELYLRAGDGGLAEVTLRQASERGATGERVALAGAEALLLQDRFDELLALAPDTSLSAPARLQLDWFRTQALVRRSHDPDRAELAAAYAAILEHAAALPGTALAGEIVRAVDIARATSHAAERAWAHHRCRDLGPEPVVWMPVDTGDKRVLRVGAERALKTPAAAAAAARDGDVVELDAGRYPGGVALWSQSDLVVRGAGTGAVITADGRNVDQRDVWLFTGDDVVVENVEISGARSRFANGAAIPHMGTGLTLRNVYLHDNENGLLTTNERPDSRIRIEFSEFAHNGDNEGYAHNVYIGRAASLTMRFSYTHEAKAGHLLKSRAGENVIEFNRISDDERGRSSYLVDIPEGGMARLVGNVFEHGYASLNHGMISFGAETIRHEYNRMTIASNTFYNRHLEAILVRNPNRANVELWNNLFGGVDLVFGEGGMTSAGNLTHVAHGMRDPRNFDFGLVAGAAAIDAAADVGLWPDYEYVHPRRGRERLRVGPLDVGAYERCGL